MKINISIIIVSYNVVTLLCKCIDSIYRSNINIIGINNNLLKNIQYPNVEIIVIDSCSTDNTIFEITKYKELKIILCNTNIGISKGNNTGVERSKGEYIFLLNPDTILFDNTIIELYKYHEAYKNVGVVGPLTYNTDGSFQPTRRRFHKLKDIVFTLSPQSQSERIFKNNILKDYYYSEYNYTDTFDVDWLQSSAILIKRQVFNDIGYFDERFFMYYDEIDWCFRAKKYGWEIYYIGCSSIIHHQGKSSINSLSAKYYNQSKIYYFRKNYGLKVGFIVFILVHLNMNIPCIIKLLQNLFIIIEEIKIRCLMRK
jgi:GT2 family glycosyltransferase